MMGAILTSDSSTALSMARLIPAAASRPSDDPIFALNAEAKARAATGEVVINATLGALMTDDGKLAVMPSVAEAFHSVDPSRAAAYAPIAGAGPFLDAVVDDVFGGTDLADRAIAVATAGGTGALHHAVVNFLAPGEELLTTSYFWGPYQTIATHSGRGVRTFEMLGEDGRLNIAGMESALEDQLRTQGRALILFNFPCHNPTGYSLDEAEWRAVSDVLCRVGKLGPVTFLVDLAYARYGSAASQAWADWLAPAAEHVLILVAWSASKAFAQYGSRVGALVAVPTDDTERDAVLAALSFSCRGVWSNCNHLGQLAITDLLTKPDQKARADAERAELVELLDSRVEVFNREASRAGLKYPRYEGGFFVTIFVNDGPKVAEFAKEDGVFGVPLKGAVRIALCSTPVSDVPRLVAALAKACARAE